MADEALEPQENLEETPSVPNPPTAEPSETPAAEPPPEPPKPTIDDRVEGMGKSLQRIQQEMAQLVKNIGKQGGQATEVQLAKLREAQVQSEKLQQDLEDYAKAGEGEDGIDLKLTRTVLEMKRELAEAKAETKELRQQVAAVKPTQEDQWKQIASDYKNVDVKKVWDTAKADAEKSITVKNAMLMLESGEITQKAFDKIYQGAASELFHSRCSAASKRQQLPTASSPPPNPPHGGRSVPMSGGASPAAPVTDPLSALILSTSEKWDKD